MTWVASKCTFEIITNVLPNSRKSTTRKVDYNLKTRFTTESHHVLLPQFQPGLEQSVTVSGTSSSSRCSSQRSCVIRESGVSFMKRRKDFHSLVITPTFLSGVSRGGQSRKTRNTSRSAEISDSSTGRNQGRTKQGRK